MKSNFFKVLAILVCVLTFSNTVFATSATNTISTIEFYSGNGKENSPYRYLIDENTKVHSQHLNKIKNKNISEIYSFHEDNDPNKGLIFESNFDLDSISKQTKGTYFLGIRFYPDEFIELLPKNSVVKYFSFVNKTSFNSKLKVRMYVGGDFLPNTKLLLGYYGGYSNTKLYSSIPIITKNEIYQIDNPKIVQKDLKVDSKGYVEFEVTHGGNYYISKNEQDFTLFYGFDSKKYSSETNLGKLNNIFATEPQLTLAIAEELGINVNDKITQKQASQIKTIYLKSKDLVTLLDLEKVYFENLDTINASNNNIELLPRISADNLQVLDFSNNSVSNLLGLKELKKLRNINFSNNYISKMPDISNFKDLEIIDLSNNLIENVPKFKNKSVKKVDLSNNRILSVDADQADNFNLTDFNIQNQNFEGHQTISVGEDFALEAVPKIIHQFGNSVGTVILKNPEKRTVYKSTFKEFSQNDYKIKSKLFNIKGEYQLSIVGYYGVNSINDIKDATLLGTYNYSIIATRDSLSFSISAIVIGAVILLILLFVIILVKRKKQ